MIIVILMIHDSLVSASLKEQQSLNQFIEPYIPLGHTDTIFASKFSSDGRLAFSLALDQTLRVWEVATGREIKRYRVNSDQVKDLAISPNGYWIATGGKDKTMKLWDSATGKKIQIFTGHKRQVNALTFSHNGEHLISAGNDKIIKVWDTKTAKLIKQYRGHKKNIQAIAVSSDGKWLASSGDDKTILIWQIKDNHSNNKIVKKLKKHKRAIKTTTFSSDGKYMVSAGEDKQIFLWELASGQVIKTFKGHTKTINAVDFSADGQEIISASDDNTLRLWSIKSGKNTKVYKGHKNKVISAAFSPNGRFILSGSQDKTMRLWGKSTAKALHIYKGHASLANDIDYSSDNQYLISAHDDKSLKLWNPITGENIKTFNRHSAAARTVVFSSNGQYLASGSSDNSIKVWAVDTDNYPINLTGHSASVNQVLFTKDNKVLSASSDNTIRLWDIHNQEILKTFKKHNRAINSIALSPTENQFVSTSKDNTIRIWNIDTGKSEVLYNSEYPINKINYLNDGKHLVAVGFDVLLMRLSDGKIIRRFKGHSALVNDVSITKNDEFLLTASWDNTVKLWDLSSGELIKTFLAHYGGVNSVSFDNSDKKFSTAGIDGSIKIWDLQKQQEIVRLIGSNDGEWVALTPDGYYHQSPEGTDLIHWVSKQTTESFAFEQFEQFFKQPDIIKERLTGKIETGLPTPQINYPPVLDLDKHLQHIETNKNQVSLSLTIEDNNPVQAIRVFVNGRLVKNVDLNDSDVKNGLINITTDVELYSGANNVTTIAYNKKGLSSDPRYFTVLSPAPKQKTKLHLLAIGVNQYLNLAKQFQLYSAVSDAENFIDRFKNTSTTLYQNTDNNNQLIIDKQATQEQIIEAMEPLKKLSRDDMVMIFFAGHGMKAPETDDYFLITHDADFKNLADTALNWKLLSKHIRQIKSRVVLFIDACHSSSISNETIVPNNELAEQLFTQQREGIMIFSAAKGRQFAQESSVYGGGEGLFSYALSKAIAEDKHKTDFNGNHIIEFTELVDYVQKYVDERSEGMQTPWLSHKELFGDFPITTISPK
ncbi:MAG: caspase family protein [Gammaproteobacteria bacterium]|nr:caspase family protein [Gammaproteobacteria bacterium]